MAFGILGQNVMPVLPSGPGLAPDPKAAERDALIKLLSQPAMAGPAGMPGGPMAPLAAPAPPQAAEPPNGMDGQTGNAPPPGSAPRPFQPIKATNRTTGPTY